MLCSQKVKAIFVVLLKLLFISLKKKFSLLIKRMKKHSKLFAVIKVCHKRLFGIRLDKHIIASLDVLLCKFCPQTFINYIYDSKQIVTYTEKALLNLLFWKSNHKLVALRIPTKHIIWYEVGNKFIRISKRIDFDYLKLINIDFIINMLLNRLDTKSSP